MAHLGEELLLPAVEVLERLDRRHIMHKHTAMRPTVEGRPERLEALLPSRVPDLHITGLGVAVLALDALGRWVQAKVCWLLVSDI